MEDRFAQQLKKGVLEMLVLKLICEKPAYGYELLSELKKSSQGRFCLKEGTLYPILTRQKNAGLLTYRWEESPQGPPRKYYSLTDKGREYLASLDEAWEELVGQIQMIRHRENDPA